MILNQPIPCVNSIVPTNSYLAYEFWMPQWHTPLGLEYILTDIKKKCKYKIKNVTNFENRTGNTFLKSAKTYGNILTGN